MFPGVGALSSSRQHTVQNGGLLYSDQETVLYCISYIALSVPVQADKGLNLQIAGDPCLIIWL